MRLSAHGFQQRDQSCQERENLRYEGDRFDRAGENTAAGAELFLHCTVSESFLSVAARGGYEQDDPRRPRVTRPMTSAKLCAADGTVTMRNIATALILALAVSAFGVSSGYVRERNRMTAGENHEASLSQRGRVYQLGRHRLMCGDATCAADVAELMDGATANMVFTDPPYNVGYIGKSTKALRIQNDALKADKFRDLLDRAFALQFTHSRAGAPIYVCHAALRTDAFASALASTGWHIAQCIVWSKHHFVLGRSDYHWKHEPILYGWKPGAPHPWYSDRKQTTVWNFKRPMRNRDHPTMKPVELVAYAIGNSSAPGNIVLDTFAGGGSTLIACEQTERTAYVMELDPRYCDVIRRRYADFRGHAIESSRRKVHRGEGTLT